MKQIELCFCYKNNKLESTYSPRAKRYRLMKLIMKLIIKLSRMGIYIDILRFTPPQPPTAKTVIT